MAEIEPRIRTVGLTARYGDFAAVKDVSLDFAANQVHALIGPTGRIFTAPRNEQTEAYITGRFG